MSEVRSPRPLTGKGAEQSNLSPWRAELAKSRQPLPEPELISRNQTAAIWNCSKSTVIRAEKAGLIDAIRPTGGGMVRNRLDQVLKRAGR